MMKAVKYYSYDKLEDQMNGVSSQDSALKCNTEPGITWTIEMNFGMNHGGSIARHVDLQYNVLWLCSHPEVQPS